MAEKIKIIYQTKHRKVGKEIQHNRKFKMKTKREKKSQSGIIKSSTILIACFKTIKSG